MLGDVTFLHWAKSIEKYIEKRQILTQSIEKDFLIDPPNKNNAIYRDSLILKFSLFVFMSNFSFNHISFCGTISCFRGVFRGQWKVCD